MPSWNYLIPAHYFLPNGNLLIVWVRGVGETGIMIHLSRRNLRGEGGRGVFYVEPRNVSIIM